MVSDNCVDLGYELGDASPHCYNRAGDSEAAIIILSPVAMDEMFELFDNKLLITDNTFHHVANRNYTD
jgi:hypothetical protein